MKLSIFGVAATIAALFLIACTTNNGSFSLVNKAKEAIAHASVAICGQTIELKDVQPNKSAAGSYEVKSDSPLHHSGRVPVWEETQEGDGIRHTRNGLPAQDYRH